MKNSIGIISIIAIMLIVAGCASVSMEDCQLTDWYEIGRMDARQGKPRTVFQKRAKACLEHGISADRQAYYKGHDRGLMYFCTEQKGFELGQKGRRYNSVCPLQLEPDFRAGYEKGREIYRYESKISALQRQLKHIERKINKKEKELYASNLSDGQRSKIRSELKSLDLKYRDVSRELKYTEDNAPEVHVY